MDPGVLGVHLDVRFLWRGLRYDLLVVQIALRSLGLVANIDKPARAYLLEGESTAQARQYLAQFDRLFSDIRLLGLTDKEFSIASNTLLSYFTLQYNGQELTREQVESLFNVWGGLPAIDMGRVAAAG